MDLEKMKQNTMGMILQFAIPSIISMVLTSFITVADGFFIGNYVGKEGIAAVNLGLPVIYLFLGIGLIKLKGDVYSLSRFMTSLTLNSWPDTIQSKSLQHDCLI